MMADTEPMPDTESMTAEDLSSLADDLEAGDAESYETLADFFENHNDVTSAMVDYAISDDKVIRGKRVIQTSEEHARRVSFNTTDLTDDLKKMAMTVAHHTGLGISVYEKEEEKLPFTQVTFSPDE